MIQLIEQQNHQACYKTFRRIIPTEIFAFFKFRQPQRKRNQRNWGAWNKHLFVHDRPSPTPTTPIPLNDEEKKLLDGCTILLEKHRKEEKEARRRAFELTTQTTDLTKSK